MWQQTGRESAFGGSFIDDDASDRFAELLENAD